MDEPTVNKIVSELIGCSWGRSIMTEDDKEICSEKAVQIVVIHDGDQEKTFKLCAAHRDRVLQETTPRENP